MLDKISEKLKKIEPSGIRKFFDIVSQKKNVISLGVGEPDFNTPWNISESAFYALEQGRTHYTSNYGLLELRVEISKYLKKYNLDYSEKESIVTVGGSEGIDLALRAVINPGDEIIIPEPIFVPYKPIVELAGGVAVSIDTSKEGFKLTAKTLKEKITDKTKAVVLCFPNNPTGVILEENELREIAELIKEHKIWCISDEIYSELTYEQEHFSIASIEGMKDCTIYLNGFSKAFAMTGWRVGYLCAKEEIINQIVKIHQYVIMCASSFAQYGAIEALRNSMTQVQKMVESYNRRRRLIVHGFREIGFEVFEPKGALYVFPDISSSGLDSEEFAIRLLNEYNVAVVPGTAFGDGFSKYIRCSYATSIEDIKEALNRISKFIENLKKAREGEN